MRRTMAVGSTSIAVKISELYDEVNRADAEHTRLLASFNKLALLQAKLQAAVDSRAAKITELLANAASSGELARLPAQIDAVEKSSNGAILKLQMNMQKENVIFTAVSNVLKTRHETVKNSIGNIR